MIAERLLSETRTEVVILVPKTRSSHCKRVHGALQVRPSKIHIQQRHQLHNADVDPTFTPNTNLLLPVQIKRDIIHPMSQNLLHQRRLIPRHLQHQRSRQSTRMSRDNRRRRKKKRNSYHMPCPIHKHIRKVPCSRTDDTRSRIFALPTNVRRSDERMLILRTNEFKLDGGDRVKLI